MWTWVKDAWTRARRATGPFRLALVIPLTPVVAGWSFGEGEWGAEIGPDFYTASAQVIPVLFLALLLELAFLFRDIGPLGGDIKRQGAEAASLREEAAHLDAEAEHDYRVLMDQAATQEDEAEGFRRSLGEGLATLRGIAVGFGLAAATGEGAALYALAAEASSGFLLIVTAGGMVTMLFYLVWIFIRRFVV